MKKIVLASLLIFSLDLVAEEECTIELPNCGDEGQATLIYSKKDTKIREWTDRFDVRFTLDSAKTVGMKCHFQARIVAPYEYNPNLEVVFEKTAEVIKMPAVTEYELDFTLIKEELGAGYIPDTKLSEIFGVCVRPKLNPAQGLETTDS